MEKISEKIKKVRISRGLKQQDICNIIKITKPAYSNIERGVTDINFSRLEQIASAFHLTPVELITFADDKDPMVSLKDKEIEKFRESLRKKDAEILELQKMVSELMNNIVELKTELLKNNKN